MSTLSLRLPNYLHENLRETAKREGVSINQLVTLAVAEKLSYLEAEQYIKAKMAQSSREKFEAVLAKVPHTEPDEHDRFDYDPEVAREKMLAVLAKAPDVEPEPYDRLDVDPAEEDERPERVLAEKPDEDYEA